MWRGPRALCLQWRLRGSLCVVRIRWFHPVVWCVVLQRHYGGGSRIVVGFFGAVSLLLSFPYQRGIVPDVGCMRWRRLLAAAPRLRSASGAQSDRVAHGDTLYGLRRCTNPISLSCLSKFEFSAC
jgi:hypothetical protein